MRFEDFAPAEPIALLVKNISVIEDLTTEKATRLPFYADGYPGLLFQETKNGLTVHPHEKQMPSLFLYGQTIKPVELVMEGSFRLIVFQLYPFVLKTFFGVNPKEINDGCHDLDADSSPEISRARLALQQCSDTGGRVAVLTALLRDQFDAKHRQLDFTIRQAIAIILEEKGQISVKELCHRTALTERTLERKFTAEAGLSPKQFIAIIRFQHSYEQLSSDDFTNLTDIVYENGFADQSHFIKVFKSFTGVTPKSFSKK